MAFNYPLSQIISGDCINDGLKSDISPFKFFGTFGPSPYGHHCNDGHHSRRCHSFGRHSHGNNEQHGHHGRRNHSLSLGPHSLHDQHGHDHHGRRNRSLRSPGPHNLHYQYGQHGHHGRCNHFLSPGPYSPHGSHCHKDHYDHHLKSVSMENFNNLSKLQIMEHLKILHLK